MESAMSPPGLDDSGRSSVAKELSVGTSTVVSVSSLPDGPTR